jgi:YHS domain-containing protein
MLKLLIFVIAGFLLFKLIMGDKKKKVDNQKAHHEKLAAEGEMVKDPVCGTYVPSDSDIRVKDGDQVHCFCSYECRDAFLKDRQAREEEQEEGEG